jgi:hypothetical protein
MGAAEPITIDIEGVNDSEVEGEATISRVGESLMVSLSLEELTGEGPFRAQILSGRCEDHTMMGQGGTTAPGTGTTSMDTTAAPGAATPSTGMQMQGQVLAALEPIQTSGAAQPGTTGQPGVGQAGMSHSTIPVTGMQGSTQAFIEVQGQGARTVACGDIDDLNRLMLGGTSGTTPGATPGTRP